jgi:histone deacetylase 11
MVLLFRSDASVRFDRFSSDHPFEIDRSGQVWGLLKDWYGSQIDRISISFEAKNTDADLLSLAHDPAFILDHLSDPSRIASTFQWPQLKGVPLTELQTHLLVPLMSTVRMVAGALSRCQLTRDTIFCLSGGYHHASFAAGGGFCLFSDIAVAVAKMRSDGRLRANDKVLYIDTDAHFGNGVAKYSDRVPLIVLDVFNKDAYPMQDIKSVQLSQKIDFPVPVARGTSDDEYLTAVTGALLKLKDSFAGKRKPPIAIYTAGVDPYYKDRLGGLSISKKGLSERDSLVFSTLKELNIPRIVLPGGGYCSESAGLYATCIAKNGLASLSRNDA